MFNDNTLEVRVPFDDIGAVNAASFDGVTAALRVNASVHSPLLCVADVFKIASGDLSLPGKISPALGEQIAVAVANRNACNYCLAAHTALGRKAGVSTDTLYAAQAGQSSDPGTKAALDFALKVVDARGQIDETDIQAMRDAGFDDEAIVEIMAHVALNLFTNYVNVAFAVPVDFPDVALRRAA